MSRLQFNYQLANTAGYKFHIKKMGFNNYDELAYYHKENFPDVELTRPGTETDLSLLNDKCLLSVNGYLYPTVYQDSKLYIPNATKSMIKSRANNIGILSFNNLSANITKLPINIAMITPEAPFTLFEKAIITFEEDIQSPILSICGYMVFENPEFFYRVSNRSFALRLDRLNYVEKLYELERYRDIFKELEIPTSVNNPTLIDASVARSDAIIIKFLTSFNSFLVNIPINNLHIEKVYLEHSNVPGNFRTEIEPNMPLMVGYGKLSEYIKKKTTDTKYTVYMNDAYYNQHLISNHSFTDITLYNDHRVIGNTYRLSQAYFLNMYTIN
jgi:hypothetical protein